MPIDLLANIDVENLAVAERFYCDAFELKVGRRFGVSAVELIGASSPIYLLEKLAGSRASAETAQTRDYARHWTPIHLDFVVENVAAAVDRALAAGARLEGWISTHEWGHIATMSDPFGHGFCLIEFRGRGYDEIAD